MYISILLTRIYKRFIDKRILANMSESIGSMFGFSCIYISVVQFFFHVYML